MEYQVQQFIEVESKIVGPLTLKQFIYIAGAGGLCVVCFSYLPIVAALLISALIIGFAAALAFYKVNGKPFINVVEAGFNYYVGAKFFLWKHEGPKKNVANVSEVAPPALRAAPKLTRGKLSALAQSLDVKSFGTEDQNKS